MPRDMMLCALLIDGTERLILSHLHLSTPLCLDNVRLMHMLLDMLHVAV